MTFFMEWIQCLMNSNDLSATYFVKEIRKLETASICPLVSDLHLDSRYTVFSVESSRAEAWSASLK